MNELPDIKATNISRCCDRPLSLGAGTAPRKGAAIITVGFFVYYGQI